MFLKFKKKHQSKEREILIRHEASVNNEGTSKDSQFLQLLAVKKICGYIGIE
jgi:hypothetical protein